MAHRAGQGPRRRTWATATIGAVRLPTCPCLDRGSESTPITFVSDMATKVDLTLEISDRFLDAVKQQQRGGPRQ